MIRVHIPVRSKSSLQQSLSDHLYGTKDAYVDTIELTETVSFKEISDDLSGPFHLTCFHDGRMIQSDRYPIHSITQVHLGCQFHLYSSKIEHSDFKIVQLGRIKDDLKVAEPSIRATDKVIVDISCLSYSTTFHDPASPYGFTGEQLCQLLHYAGTALHCRDLYFTGFDQMENLILRDSLLHSFIWYFHNGITLRPLFESGSKQLEHYVVELEEYSLAFDFNPISQQWWLRSPLLDKPGHTIACTEQAYNKAKNNEIPEELLENL